MGKAKAPLTQVVTERKAKGIRFFLTKKQITRRHMPDGYLRMIVWFN